MTNPEIRKEKLDPEWAREVPLKRFSTPYNFSEKLRWAKNLLVGPSKKYKGLTNFIPHKSHGNAITAEMKLGFLGDIMAMGDKDLRIHSRVEDFFKDVDFLVGNFEGVISSKKKGILGLRHSKKVIDSLGSLFNPLKFVLCCANNHSGDFGWTEFNNSYQLLKEKGFLAIGRKDEPSILLKDQINLACATAWSNQPCSFVLKFGEIDKYLNESAKFNILFPHWGYEFRLYPNPAQIELGQELLEKWDMIVGHLSHMPQPITFNDKNGTRKILAYSLGDFTLGSWLKKARHGLVVKTEVGPAESGTWQVGEVEWSFTEVHEIDKKSFEVRLEDDCRYFKS